MELFGGDKGNFPNNTIAINNMVKNKSYMPLDCFDNQSYYPILDKVAKNIAPPKLSPYDYELDKLYIQCMHDYYFNGGTYAAAEAEFLKKAKEKFPELK